MFDDFSTSVTTLINSCCDATLSSTQDAMAYLCNANVLACMHVNCRSLGAHQTDVESILHVLHPNLHLCVLTETWLTDDAVCPSFNGYNSFHVVRKGQLGDGESLLIRNDISSFELAIVSKPTTFEIVCRRIVISSASIFAIGVNRKPNTGLSLFLNELESVLSEVSNLANPNTFRLMLAGDFIVNLFDYNGPPCRLMDVLMSFSLYPTIFPLDLPAVL